MNNRFSILLAASAFALAACNSPSADEATSQAAADAEVAGDQAAVAADSTGDAAEASAEAATATASASAAEAEAEARNVATAADGMMDPLQQAYEEGKANAAETIGDAAANVADVMEQEQAEAEAEANAELQD